MLALPGLFGVNGLILLDKSEGMTEMWYYRVGLLLCRVLSSREAVLSVGTVGCRIENCQLWLVVFR